MTLKIAAHSRGLLIQVLAGSQPSEVGRRLRSRMPRDHILPHAGQFIVPLEAANLVASEFAADDVMWDEEVWKAVESQRQIISRMEASTIEVAEALSAPKEFLRGYALIDRLDPHQIEAVAAMSAPSLVGLALFDEQGLGKTYMVLCAFDRLRETGHVGRLLVLAPKSVLASWTTDIQKLFESKYVVKTVDGTQFNRMRRIKSRFDILLCGYESAVSELRTLKSVIKDADERFMLAVDESYFVKNPVARRSIAVSELRAYCDRAIILCGTPAPNAPHDLIHQLNITSAGHFSANSIIPKDKSEASEFISQSLDRMIYLRRLKGEVFPDMPRKEFEKVFIELSPIQRTIYDRARRDLVLTVRSVDDREFLRHLGTFLARRAALTQICSHPGALDPLYNETPAKLLALDRLLYELIMVGGKKVVIWSFFRHSLQSIASRYKSYGLVRVDGSVVSLDKRKEAIRSFQEDANTKIFLGNAAAAGAGITLTAAHHAIYESFSNQAAHYMQSVDRIHRRGQTEDVTNHILLAQQTIEAREFERLLEKEEAGRDLLGDRYEEVISRERFLAELDSIVD